MTSIHCPECSTLVSGSDQNCPQCNFPISKLRGLSASILTRNAERVAGLIQLGADVNAVDKNGRTPLMTAALIDDPEIVQMLFAAGARPEFVNKDGETALSVAKSREVERLIRRAIVVSKFQRAQTPETLQTPVIQQEHAAEIEASPKPKVEQQPLAAFDHSIMLTEIPPSPQINQVTPIDAQLNDELFELQNHKVLEEFPEPFLFEEAPPTQHNKAMPVDVQLNEELFEPPQSYKVQEELLAEPLVFDEIPPQPQINQRMPIDVQLNEEWMEPVQSHDIYEEPLPDPIVVESQPAEELPIDEQPVFAELPIYMEPVVADQQFVRPAGPRYFFAAIVGCSLLLLFMGLTWPRYTSSIPRTTESPKPVKQIVKQEPEKQLPVPKNEIAVAQEPKMVESIPEAQPIVPIPEPQAQEPVIKSEPKTKFIGVEKPKSIVVQKQKPIGAEEKIRLARALNSQGYSLIKQGKIGEAIPVLERSLQSFPKDTKDPHYGYALYNLAVAWRKAGRPDLAIPILEKRMKIEDQRNIVARELFATRQEAQDAGFGNFRN